MKKKEYEYLKSLKNGYYLFLVERFEGVEIEELFFNASTPFIQITEYLRTVERIGTTKVLRVLTEEEEKEYKETIKKLTNKFLEKEN